MTKEALIIIDIQNDYFTNGKMALDNSAAAGKNATKVLVNFREKKLPVIHIQHESLQPGATFFIPETSGMDIHSSVAPQEKEVVLAKHYPNSFRETGLNEILKDLDITNLTIIGMMSNMCVDATTRAAFDFGYTCTVVHDACAATSLEFNGVKVPSVSVHASFMAALGAVYAKMVATGDFIRS
ncbi:cysteine hydrolase family protein [Maridesulfovibrio frigidus]|uniref:cysteine hydrolase family protein n=1 Tax=Maridesulfovibrio frigidus TaxID=340956 RepID=UPI0004E1700B|nr:cysteine hydrolase family protein [Maridesulfovibrio frigidus]